MQYVKGALSFEAQADRLISRGLQADRDALIRRLSAVSYYRLSGYLYPFRREDSDDFIDGASLALVWDRYCFDRRLRVLLLDVIERVEVAVRTQLVYHFAHTYGPFGYCDENNLPDLSVVDYIKWRENLLAETSRSKEAFIKHFSKKYGDCHRNLPIWMLSELMSMGSMLTFYRGVGGEIASQVANHFGLPKELLLSWLRSLYAVRNLCAHHSRLWNRVLGYAPALPQKNKHPAWHQTNDQGKKVLPNDRVGIIMMICRTFLARISPTSQWKERVEQLFHDYPDIPAGSMGLTEDWQEHSLWKS